jgi:hypothetical protein
MTLHTRTRSTLFAALICMCGMAVAQEPVAEQASPSAPVADPPSRVARLSLMEGDVSIAPAGTDEWAQAVLNRPLTSGDRIWVDGDGRAELQVGSATIHLSGGTTFSFLDLDDESLRMSVTDGAISIRVRRKLEREVIEVSTPNAVVALLHPGEYSVEINDTGNQTTVRTRSGESQVRGDDGTYLVRANEQGVFTGKDRLAANVGPVSPRSDFERWANERDRTHEAAVSSRYVSDDVIGYEDLDHYGSWVSEPEYGYVWRPTYVAAGWAPYRHGRWVWVSPWGWSWVDAAPWGFAPFHYGRWAHVRSRWCWVPGPRYVRAVYAPAHVGWYGGSHFSVSVSFGSAVGWFPLAPHEVFVPGYRHSHRYIHSVNVSNTVIVNNNHFNNVYRGGGHGFDYRHRRHPHAVTLVNRDTFVGGRPIGDRQLHVDANELGRFRGGSRPPSITPGRDSVFAGDMRGNRPFVRLNHPNRPVTTDRMPRSRIPFEDERRAIGANNGRPIDRSAMFTPPKERGDFRIVGNSRGDKEPRQVARTMGAGNGSNTAFTQHGRGWGSTSERDARGQPNGRVPGSTQGFTGGRSGDRQLPSELGMTRPRSDRGSDRGDFRGGERGSRSDQRVSGDPPVHAFSAYEPGSTASPQPPSGNSSRSRSDPSRGRFDDGRSSGQSSSGQVLGMRPQQQWSGGRSQRDSSQREASPRSGQNSPSGRWQRDDRSSYGQRREDRGGSRQYQQSQPRSSQSYDRGSMSNGQSSMRSGRSHSDRGGSRSSSSQGNWK